MAFTDRSVTVGKPGDYHDGTSGNAMACPIPDHASIVCTAMPCAQCSERRDGGAVRRPARGADRLRRLPHDRRARRRGSAQARPSRHRTHHADSMARRFRIASPSHFARRVAATVCVARCLDGCPVRRHRDSHLRSAGVAEPRACKRAREAWPTGIAVRIRLGSILGNGSGGSVNSYE